MHTTKDDDLRAIRAGQRAREAELRERVRRVQEDWKGEVTPLPRDAPDAAIVLENEEILQAVDETARSELKQIERALERLEVGTYGLCGECGQSIGLARLKAVPYTLHCRSCAEGK